MLRCFSPSIRNKCEKLFSRMNFKNLCESSEIIFFRQISNLFSSLLPRKMPLAEWIYWVSASLSFTRAR